MSGRAAMGRRGTGRRGTSSGPTLRWIVGCAGPDLWLVALILAVETAQAVLGLVLAMWMRQLVNAVTAGDGTGFRDVTLSLVLLLAALVALGGARRFLRDYTQTSLLNRYRLREFGDVLERDYRKVSGVHSGEWMNRMSSDATVVADGITDIVPDVLSMLVRMVGALCLLLTMLPELAWVIIPGGVALMLLTFLFRGRLKRLHTEQQEAQGRVRVFLLDRLQSLLVIHSFSRERAEHERGGELMDDFRRVRMRRSNFSNVCNVGFAAAMDGAYILGVCYCAWKMLQGTMSYGTLIAVMSLVSQIQSPFANISGYVPRYYAMLASAERLMEAERWEETFATQPHDADEVRALYERLDCIRLEHAGFSYDHDASGRRALRDLSASFPRGGIVAVTGPSGCGKSTLLKVLMGVYRLDGGSCSLVTFDHAGDERAADAGEAGAARAGEPRDASETGRGVVPLDASWRGLFAYVPQGNQLMAGTVRDVVAFGDTSAAADDEAVWRALRGACAEGFVRGLPQGLDTELGEKGSGLSEGQMQRIAIARALFSGHPVLLLDEATSSLDETTEHELLLRLRELTDRTVILVTHRRAALGMCDAEVSLSGEDETAWHSAGRADTVARPCTTR